MSSDPKEGAAAKSGMGCGGWLGMVILLLAVAAVVFYFIVKPRLEERGVDVDSKLETLSGEARAAGGKVAGAVKSGYGKVKSEAPEMMEQAAEKVGSGYRTVKENAGKTAEKVSEKAEKGVEKVESWY